jgi:hypothetical protein
MAEKFKIPVPIRTDKGFVVEVEADVPDSGVLMAVADAAGSSGQRIYKAMAAFVRGCIEAMILDNGETISNKKELTRIVNKMTVTSAETISVDILLMYAKESDAWVDGNFQCKSCKQTTRDDQDPKYKIANMKRGYLDPGENIGKIELILKHPITLADKNTKNPIEKIDIIEMRNPTLNDAINAVRVVGSESKALKNAIYAESVIAVNGNPVPEDWVTSLGLLTFQKMKLPDLFMTGEEVGKTGLKKSMEEKCSNCGKKYTVTVSTESFFDSGFRG